MPGWAAKKKFPVTLSSPASELPTALLRILDAFQVQTLGLATLSTDTLPP